jgi:putative protein kinase ArgK-like GTPase of G3E family
VPTHLNALVAASSLVARCLTAEGCNMDSYVGIDALWETVLSFKAAAESGGGMASGRRAQRVSWLWAAVGDMVTESLQRDPSHAALVQQVTDGSVSPAVAAAEIVGALGLPER